MRRIVRADDPAQSEEDTSPGVPRAYLKSAFERAQGNVVRVGELLAAEYEMSVSYSTLTRWVRDAGLRLPPVRAGEYTFAPGEEMQHDTSPHRVPLGEKTVTAQCAGLVLAYSRRLFIQYYPHYTRFEAKEFLLEAVRFMDGACPRCIIDNTRPMRGRSSNAATAAACAPCAACSNSSAPIPRRPSWRPYARRRTTASTTWGGWRNSSCKKSPAISLR